VRRPEVDRSLPGLRVARVLDRLEAAIGLPQTIVVDNGPEFAGRTLAAWAYRTGVTLRFIRPGKPIENAYVESFNSSIAQLRNGGRADGRSRVTPTGTLMIDDCGEVDVIQEILKGRHR